MSLLCKLVDHKFVENDTRTETKEKNNIQVKVKTKIYKCSRCGHCKEDKFRTIVDNLDNNSRDKSENDSNHNSDNHNSDNHTNKISEDILDKENPNESGVVILKSNNKKDKNKQENDKYQLKDINIYCDNCNYSVSKPDQHLREGDYCPKCSEWLTQK